MACVEKHQNIALKDSERRGETYILWLILVVNQISYNKFIMKIKEIIHKTKSRITLAHIIAL